jgi:hypothetical protein
VFLYSFYLFKCQQGLSIVLLPIMILQPERNFSGWLGGGKKDKFLTLSAIRNCNFSISTTDECINSGQQGQSSTTGCPGLGDLGWITKKYTGYSKEANVIVISSKLPAGVMTDLSASSSKVCVGLK